MKVNKWLWFQLTARPSPFVFWAQTDKHVTLKVDLKDVTSPDVELKAQNLSFSASGHGARGLHDYQFKLNFHSLINPEVWIFYLVSLLLICVSGKRVQNHRLLCYVHAR